MRAMASGSRVEQAGSIDLDEQETELPPLDGDDGEPTEDPAIDEDEIDPSPEDDADPLDDSTGEGDPVEELSNEEERSWLTDAEPAEGLELGTFDLGEERSFGSAIGDDEEPGVEGEDFGLDDGGAGSSLLDGGEEGPSGPDEELRESDLPELDADGDEDGNDSMLDEVTLDDDAPLPWDPSPWERVSIDGGPDLELRPREADVEAAERTLGRLGLSKMGDLRITAEVAALGGSLIALVSRIAGRSWLVQTPASFARGEARIVAEVGGAAFGDDPEILSLAWDETRGVAWVGGLFGLLAFQPREGRATGDAPGNRKSSAAK